MSCKPMAFIMTVLRISLTLSRAFRMPGMNPQNAPARNPMIMVAGISSQPGQVRNCSENQVVINAPAMIWPSPPMLMHAGAEGDADAQTDQQQGRRLNQRLRETVRAAEDAFDHGGVCSERIGAQEEKHDCSHEEGDEDGQDRRCCSEQQPHPVNRRLAGRRQRLSGRIWRHGLPPRIGAMVEWTRSWRRNRRTRRRTRGRTCRSARTHRTHRAHRARGQRTGGRRDLDCESA